MTDDADDRPGALPGRPGPASSPWPADKLTALRLGRRLVTEVPASGPGRRAFVDIQPIGTDDDGAARAEGWARAERDRAFKLTHREYDADRLEGFDYDAGEALTRATTVHGEAALIAE